MPSLPEARTDIESCLHHISEHDLQGTSIEQHLTAHLLATVCAVYESEFQRVALERLGKQVDPYVASFLKAAVERTWRGLRLDDVAGFLAHFDQAVKTSFKKGLLDNPSAIAFANIVTARHNSAHGLPFEMTLAELLESFDRACGVLEVGMLALTQVRDESV
jgi:hypothetical protein